MIKSNSQAEKFQEESNLAPIPALICYRTPYEMVAKPAHSETELAGRRFALGYP
jgi:hypothetical protein